MDTGLQRAYDTYWEARERVKAEQRAELTKRLVAETRVLQKAMQSAINDDGMSVSDIADEIGLKGKNFIYDILGETPTRVRRKGRVVPNKINPEAEQKPLAELFPHYAYILDKDLTPGVANTYIVKIVNDIDPQNEITVGVWDIETNEHGEIDKLPDEWFSMEMPERDKPFYRQMIAEIEGR